MSSQYQLLTSKRLIEIIQSPSSQKDERDFGRMARSIPPAPMHDEQQTGAEVLDYLSEFSDDFLIRLLSRLTLDDAARTSVLSRRWRCLWTHVAVLNFDAQKDLDELNLVFYSGDDLDELFIEKQVKYVKWVNRVMEVSKAPVIESLRIRFDLDERDSDQIDRWIHFAMEKQVEIFTLNLSCFDGASPEKRYGFDAFHSTAMEDICRWGSLRALELVDVDISEAALETFLSSCQSLESLAVTGSDTLKNLKVSGAALKLKHLKISKCYPMHNLEISVENLVSLNYVGKIIKLPFTYAPNLVEISFGSTLGNYMIRNMFQLSTYATSLISFSLHSIQVTRNMECFQCPVLQNLKELKLSAIAMEDNATLIGITSLIEKSPSLQRFSLELSEWSPCGESFCFDRELIQARRCIHREIKVVEFCEFVGKVIEMELMMFFIENAIALEMINVVIRPQMIGIDIEAAMKSIENARTMLPSGVKLITIVE